MKLGDLTFPIDSWDELPYRDLIDLKDFLEKGLASPFWSAYREIVSGNAKGYEKAILFPSSDASLDGAFEAERTRGKLLATALLLSSPERLLEDVKAQIAHLQAQENPGESHPRKTLPPDDNGSGAGGSAALDTNLSP